MILFWSPFTIDLTMDKLWKCIGQKVWESCLLSFTVVYQLLASSGQIIIVIMTVSRIKIIVSLSLYIYIFFFSFYLYKLSAFSYYVLWQHTWFRFRLVYREIVSKRSTLSFPLCTVVYLCLSHLCWHSFLKTKQNVNLKNITEANSSGAPHAGTGRGWKAKL